MQKTILIIEDETSLRKCLYDFIEMNGYAVLEAVDTDQGLQMFENNTVDLVISDLLMPGPDVIKMLASIKSINPDIKIIIISGILNWMQYVEVFTSLDVQAILQKPFALKELLTAIENVFIGESCLNIEKWAALLEMSAEGELGRGALG